MKNLEGLKFGKYTVISRGDRYRTQYKWKCICECGREKQVYEQSLIRGKSNSCVNCSNTKHGKVTSVEYHSWVGMKSRCYNKNEEKYNTHGARGITVCDRWLNSFENFLEDMGERPIDKKSLDRIDNEGNYEPGNCRWADDYEQANNKRNNILLTYKGKTQNLTQWCKELNLNYKAIHNRVVNLKWDVEKCFEYKYEQNNLNNYIKQRKEKANGNSRISRKIKENTF